MFSDKASGVLREGQPGVCIAFFVLQPGVTGRQVNVAQLAQLRYGTTGNKVFFSSKN